MTTKEWIESELEMYKSRVLNYQDKMAGHATDMAKWQGFIDDAESVVNGLKKDLKKLGGKDE